MSFKETYAATSDKAEEKIGKKVISDDAFAIGDTIQELIKTLRLFIK